MTDKEKLRLILKYTKLAVIVIVIAVLLGAMLFAAKFSIDFFRNGLFGDGSTYGFVGEFLGIPEPTAPVIGDDEDVGLGVVARASILVGGDVIMHMPVIKSGLQEDGNYNFDATFAKISNYVNRADYAALNLETTLGGTENGNAYSGSPKFNCPDEIVDAAKNAGFDMYLTGNNHANDTGAAGLRRTHATITEKGMNVLGTTGSEEAPGWQVLDLGGIKIGMVCYTHGTYSASGRPAVNGLDLDDSVASLINIFDYEKTDTFYTEMEAKIAAMKEAGAEAIVLFIHWGDQYKLAPNDAQKAIAQKMCDLGVDVIAGGHPHTVQPVTLLQSANDAEHKTLCVYSLGNLLSNERSDNVGVPSGHTEDGVLFTFSFVKYSDGRVCLDTAELLPIWIQMWKEEGVKRYCILPLDGSVSDWKKALGIDDGALSSARASYERTTAIIGESLSAVQTALEEARAIRESALGIDDEGVG